MNLSLKEIAEKLKNAKSVAIFSHMRPDGDAYGSSLALSRALGAIGVKVCVCNDSDVPSNLAFVSALSAVKKRPAFDADVYVAVDCADESRLGDLSGVFALARNKKPTFNIDHHISNTRFAQYNFVRDCSSNCLNIFQLITDMGAPIDKETAEMLLTKSVEEIAAMPCMPKGRADVLAGGAVWLATLMQKKDIDELIVSDRDNLEGFAVKNGLME